jgi:hypothetical protein
MSHLPLLLFYRLLYPSLCHLSVITLPTFQQKNNNYFHTNLLSLSLSLSFSLSLSLVFYLFYLRLISQVFRYWLMMS